MILKERQKKDEASRIENLLRKPSWDISNNVLLIEMPPESI